MSYLQLAMLRNKYRRDKADIKYGRRELRRAAQRQTQEMRSAKRDDLKSMDDNFATQGTSQSGIKAGEKASYMEDWTRQRGQQLDEVRRGNRDLDRAKFDIENNYSKDVYGAAVDTLTQNKMMAEMGIDPSRITEIVSNYTKPPKKKKKKKPNAGK